MHSFNQKFVVSVILFSFSFTGSVFAAKKGGISDQTTKVVASFKAPRISTGFTTIANTADSSDTDASTTGDTSTSSEVNHSQRICDFSGFDQNDFVNNAYNGGTSSNGVVKPNQKISFNGAKVLNSYYGANQPNLGIVYSPNGLIVLSLVNFSGIEISFAYTSSAVLTVSQFISTDGTGTPINSRTAAATLPYGPFNVWKTFTMALNSNTKSIVISGTPDKWGMDQVVVLAGPDCNGNNILDAIDISNGTSQDCNDNEIPDSCDCDIEIGNSRDVNGNKIPDECEAPATLTLTNDAGACNRVGGSVNVDATLSGVLSPIVSGQIYISWNPANMSLNSITAGDAPFDQLPLHTINQSAGTALLVTSIGPGQPPVSVISKIVARMQFTIRGGTCDGSGTGVQFFPDGTLPTTFTDGLGSELIPAPALVASSGFKVDDGAPVLSNVPANVMVQAEAGMGSFANVALTPPTATDACSPLTESSARSDGASLNAAFPVGTTTVTWSVTDTCGNTTTDTTTVTVNNSHTGEFKVSYPNSGSYAASSARLLTLNIHGANGYTLKASQPVTLVNGAGTITLTDLAVDIYDCVAIEEKARSLRRVATVIDGGLVWSSTATLVAGDLINDEVVDVLDWGAYIVGNPNADLDGNSMINVNDGNIIIGNFGQRGDTGCGTSFMSPPEPLSGISVAELVDRGLNDLVSADLNNDGWLDMEDVHMSTHGARLNRDGWVDVEVSRSAN